MENLEANQETFRESLDNLNLNEDGPETRIEKIQLLLFALLAGAAFDYLFYGELIGISYPVFVILLLGGFWWNTRRRFTFNNRSLPLLGLILVLSLTFGIYSNPVLETINFLLIPLLIAVYTMLSTNREFKWWGITTIVDILKRCVPKTILNFAKPFVIVAREFKPRRQDAASQAGKKILLGLLLSVPILLLVIPLLSSADVVFRSYVTNLTDISDYINLRSLVGQTIVIFAVFVYVFGFVWSFYANQSDTKAKEVSFGFTWDTTIIITVLTVINMVYLFFSIIQFSYLYSGAGNQLPAGFTYAEYARRGFWELVAVTIINLSILLSCMKFGQKDNKSGYLWTRILLGALIAFSLNMLFAAHFKMSLYENAYGLTYLRVFVHYFMGLLLVFFLLALGNITFVRLHLVKAFILASLVFYTILNFINVDHLIIKHNLEMYAETGEVDISYIVDLSDDAVPVMVSYAQNNDTSIASWLRSYLLNLKAKNKPATTWKSFNYSRYKAQAALDKLN